MLADRSYMRPGYPQQGTSMLTWMVCALIAAFVLQLATSSWDLFPLERLLVLTPAGLRHGRVWTLLTYVLMHGGILHLLFNCLSLYLIGRELIGPLGSVRFLGLSLSAALLGALFWFACHFNQGGLVLLGASGIVAGLFVVFACLFPEQDVTFLAFYVLPITVKPKLLAWILLGVELVGFLFGELPRGGFDQGIAHSAHLGGMLAGWLFYRFFYARNGLDLATSFAWPAWLRRRPKRTAVTTPKSRLELHQQASLRSEVDRILDKINSHGFGALTDQEKRLLDEAKDLLSRR